MKALVIANNLLQKKSPASPIETSLLEELSKKGVNITAVCSSLGPLNDKSQTFNTLVVRETVAWTKIYSIGKKIFPDIFNIPDYHRYSWGSGAKAEAFNCLGRGHYDMIQSISAPASCHLVAYYLHKKTGLPWIASFFDSWTDYPMTKYRTSFFKNINKQLERTVAENATVIVLSNENFARVWEKRYGESIAKKIVVIPFNESFYNEYDNQLVTDNKDILNISHVGTFYPFRNASAFIDGVKLFTEKYPQYRNRIKINFVGRTLTSDLEKITKYGLDECFNITGQISPKECEQVYADSDVLLAIAEEPFEDYTYPSKIMKYFYYQKPLLGVCTKSSVLYTELEKTGHRTFTPDDSEGIADYIYQALNNYKSVCGFKKDYWKRFKVDNVANQYMDCIKKMLGK